MPGWSTLFGPSGRLSRGAHLVREKGDRKVLGMAVVIMAAIIWGSTGVAGEYLLNTRGLDSAWLTTFRTSLGGILMLAVLAPRYKGALLDVWKDAHSVVRLAVFGLIGIAANLYLYMLSVQASNAPTATTLQYLSPAFTVLWMALRNRRPPVLKEIVAVTCALIGVVLVSTKGNLDVLSISAHGLVIGVLSAAALAFYGVYPRPLLATYGPLVTYAWGQLVGGVCMNMLRCPLWQFTPPSDGVIDIPLILVLGWQLVFGTVISYAAYLVGVDMIGPSRASMLSSVEPGATAVLAAMLLSTPLVTTDYEGIALMTACVVILSLPSAEA